MSGNDIFNAISNIDPKYIDEAAYELHSREGAENSVSGSSITDISSRSRTLRTRKFIWVALPSVAAVLLILGVAVPAILRTGSTQPAATSEAPADNAEATAEAEAVDEAAPAAEEEPSNEAAAEAVPEFAQENSEEEMPAMSDETLAAGTDSNKDRQTYSLNAAGETAEAEAEAEEAVPSPVAVYENGLLTIDTAEFLHGSLDEAKYEIFDINDPQSAEPVAKGSLKDVTDQEELTDEPLVLDLTSLALKPGEYRIEMETGTAEFTVPR